jgi:hypothetical protein
MALPYAAKGGMKAAESAGEAVGDLFKSGANKLKKFFHLKKGGRIPGKGPKLIVAHGGEMVLPSHMVKQLLKRKPVMKPIPKSLIAKGRAKPAVRRKRR